MKPFVVLALILATAAAQEQATDNVQDSLQDEGDSRQSRKIDDTRDAVLDVMEEQEDAKKSEVQEQSYIERIGNRYCSIADGRNVFQNSCSR